MVEVISLSKYFSTLLFWQNTFYFRFVWQIICPAYYDTIE